MGLKALGGSVSNAITFSFQQLYALALIVTLSVDIVGSVHHER
jgi:hypothetical protein